MPCYQVNLMSVELKVRSKETLVQALRRLGKKFVDNGDVINVPDEWIIFDLAAGKVSAPANRMVTINKVKQEYSRLVVDKVARAKGWSVRKINNRKLQIRKAVRR